ncbi:hypothetical protein ACFRI7_14705 [Streptomyces sp. NPDC056716]|uniref:hypothetical protein n=1 Tax=unclassified Streptomyces TaxID=2593676 RepID=UPI0036CE7AD6
MDRSFVSVRGALVLLLAGQAGAGIGLLSALAGGGVMGAVLAGLTDAGGAVPVFNQVIAPDPCPSGPAVGRDAARGGSDRA